MDDFGRQNNSSWFRNTRDFIWELVKIIVIALAIIIPVRFFLIQPFYVQGASMEPNFYDKEYLLVDEISYRFRKPVRGEILVFRLPGATRFFIKRLIGLPGETIILHNRKITVVNDEFPKGLILDEASYLGAADDWRFSREHRINLEPDEYFVLGDNRLESYDSRAFGAIKSQSIIGRTWLRGWPLERAMKFDPPEY